MLKRRKKSKKDAPRPASDLHLREDAAVQLVERGRRDPRAAKKGGAQTVAPPRVTRRVRSEKQRKKARRRRVLRVLSRVFLIALIIGAGISALTVFFRVGEIQVTGDTRYESAKILEAAGVQKGDNLFLLRKGAVEKHLREQFPYLEEVDVVRQLPNQLVIVVADAQPEAALVQGDACYLVSERGKVLERVKLDDVKNVPVVRGITPENPKIGHTISAHTEGIKQLQMVLHALDAHEMQQDVGCINLQQLYDVRIGYLDRFDLHLGSLSDENRVLYQLRYAKKIVDEYLSPSEFWIVELDTVPEVHTIPTTKEEFSASAVKKEEAGEKHEAE